MIQIRVGLASGIRIRVDVKSWIRIRIETNADTQHWQKKVYRFTFTFYKRTRNVAHDP
jgi:hypothetical protein